MANRQSFGLRGLATKWVKVSHWNFAVLFFSLRGSFEHGLSESRIKKGVTVFVFFFLQTGRNEHCWSMGVNGKRQKFGNKYQFISACLKYFNIFDFSLKYGQRNNCGEKKWGSQNWFQNYIAFCVEICPRRYELHWGSVHQDQEGASEQIECTCHSPAVWCQGRARGVVTIRRYDHVGSSPAWILLLHASLLKRGWIQSPGAWSVSVSSSSQFNKWAILIKVLSSMN